MVLFTKSFWYLFQGSSKEANENGGRFTPTPRRSIHSYKVTETSKETVTKMKDGTIARDFEYKKLTSDDQEEIGGYRKIVKLIPSLFLILIVLAVAYYIYMVSLALSRYWSQVRGKSVLDWCKILHFYVILITESKINIIVQLSPRWETMKDQLIYQFSNHCIILSIDMTGMIVCKFKSEWGKYRPRFSCNISF